MGKVGIRGKCLGVLRKGCEVTKSPACLHQTKFGVVDKEWNGTVQEIWLWLEVRIKDGHIIAIVYIVMPHSLLQGTSLVTIAVATDLIPDIDAFARPSLDLHLHQLLNFFDNSLAQLYHQLPFMSTTI